MKKKIEKEKINIIIIKIFLFFFFFFRKVSFFLKNQRFKRKSLGQEGMIWIGRIKSCFFPFEQIKIDFFDNSNNIIEIVKTICLFFFKKKVISCLKK